MAYIITSKTRSRMMRQPQERAKVLNERRSVTFEKHAVKKVNSLGRFSEMEIHEELDNQGSGIKESMLANQEREEINAKLKRAAEAPVRERIIKERIKKLEARDEKNGKMEEGRKFQAQARKRRKK